MEDVRGAVNVVLHGPAERFDEALAAIQAAGISAKRDRFETEAISAFFHDGTSNPPEEFIKACEARVHAAAEGTGFRVAREAAVWGSNAATRQLPYNRHTGEWLEAFVDGEMPLDLREELLEELAERYGISVNDIELRDPDYLTPPSE
ncbi:hypothetical protein [Streptomyces sp. NEAU-H3]|uniref:hypothetical protein n=1 Tax=Streptomyces sp. NEAU-H3 TaxID=2720636 RepID=UPI00143A7375|nr:hypothetical protein [Streptomyces sp. NEAU-H3]NJA56739.1 hypothetical protein [Streptomyces sp. NEAU-H3]